MSNELEGIMKQNHKRQIEKILGEIKCRGGITCYKPGIENLCKAIDTGLEDFLECPERDPQVCKLSLSFGYSYLCKCPLGLYIAKKLKR